MSPQFPGIAAVTRAVKAGGTSAVELTSQSLRAIDELDGELLAFTARDDAAALRDAAEIDRRIRDGEPVGALAGLPVAVKDLYDSVGLPTSYGSRAFPEYMPIPDSTAVARLRSSGAIVVGRREQQSSHGAPPPPRQRTRPRLTESQAARVVARRPPSHQASSMRRSEQTRAARSGSRPRCAESRGSSRRTGPSAEAASCLRTGHWTPPGHWRDVLTISDSSLAVLVGHDRRDVASAPKRLLEPLVARLQSAAEIDLEGLRLGLVQEPLFEITDDLARDAHQAAIELLAAEGAIPIPVGLPETDFVEGALLRRRPSRGSRDPHQATPRAG